MPKITFEGQEYACSSDESLLDSLTRHGLVLPSGCRGGSCQACLLRAVEGTPPPASQHGLKPTLKEQGYFLPCICKPGDDLVISLADHSQTYTASIAEKKQLNEAVYLIRLNKPEGFHYHPGQFINLIQAGSGLVRSYSLASITEEGFLELHIKHVPGGKVSSWLCSELEVGDELEFMGPSGNCFYLPEGNSDHPLDQPLVLAGTGTGLAPLYGILRDALKQGHRGEIQLFHASVTQQGLYYEKELLELALQNRDKIRYIPCVLQGDAPSGGKTGPIDKVVVGTISSHLGSCNGIRAYLCGDAPVVEAMKKQIFFAGASMHDIYADAFAFTPNE